MAGKMPGHAAVASLRISRDAELPSDGLRAHGHYNTV